MSIILIETIQQNLHYPPLIKIDPNTQEVKASGDIPNENRFSQAAIPAVLTGLYKYASTNEGAEEIMRGTISSNWVNLIFGDSQQDVMNEVSSYAALPQVEVHGKMNEIAAEAIQLIRKDLKPDASMMDVKNYMSSQKNNILLYLPESMHIGAILKDDTLDDNTNKMEGPVSSLMHKIGSAFSKPTNEEEVNSKP